MKHCDDTPEGLRGLLARDHRELERLYEELTSALRGDARHETLQLWTAFDDGLCRHMALEESSILPHMQAQDPGTVSMLRSEHDEIRRQLAELGLGIDLHDIPVQVLEDFIARLRAHAKREDALAYRWAEANLPALEQRQIGASLSATSTLRQRLLGLGRKMRARGASAL